MSNFGLGLFDNPYRGDGKLADKIVHCKEHQAVALEAARQSIVLLKNQDNLLPLQKTLKSVAVIGPNADEQKELICPLRSLPMPQSKQCTKVLKKPCRELRWYIKRDVK